MFFYGLLSVCHVLLNHGNGQIKLGVLVEIGHLASAISMVIFILQGIIKTINAISLTQSLGILQIVMACFWPNLIIQEICFG